MPPPALSRSALVAGLRALGVREGSVLMVHARMSALGWVVGGSGTVVSALLEALGPEGTLVAYASWEEHVYHAASAPAARSAPPPATCSRRPDSSASAPPGSTVTSFRRTAGSDPAAGLNRDLGAPRGSDP